MACAAALPARYRAAGEIERAQLRWIGAAVVPVLVAVRRGLERLLFGDRHDPDLVARRLAERLAATPEELLPQVVEEVARTLRAAHAGLAVHSAMLTAALAHSAERLRLARAEERVRLRRDLHDGLGPALGAIAMRAEAARNLLGEGHGADRVAPVLAGIQDGAEEAVAEVRRILAELQPQVLQEQGLRAALTHVAGTAPGLPVHLDLDEHGPLPPTVELALYRIAAEALRNVTRHAGACHAAITLRHTGDQVELTVADDGRGLPEHPPQGVGLGWMRARAAELGGHVDVVALPDDDAVRAGVPGHPGPAATGTMVRARIPLEVP